MGDIVERLRWRAENTSTPTATTPMLCAGAADEIERLRSENENLGKGAVEQAAACGRLLRELHAVQAENEKLRAALEMFACDCVENDLCKFPHACRNYVARAALEGK